MGRLFLSLSLLAFVVAGASASAAPVLSPEAIGEALAFGRKASEKDLEQYVLKVAPSWTVNFDTPYLRVAQFAMAMKTRRAQPDVADVPSAILQPVVHVYALAMQQPGTTEEVRNVKGVMIYNARNLEFVSPSAMKTNLNRARVRGDYTRARIAESIEAVFSLSDFKAGNEVRVSFEGGAQESVLITRALLDSVR